MATRMTAWPAPRQFVKSHLTENHLVENHFIDKIFGRIDETILHIIYCVSRPNVSRTNVFRPNVSDDDCHEGRCVSTKRQSAKCLSATSRGPRLLRGEKHKEHKRQF
jgi:hypothetical protein